MKLTNREQEVCAMTANGLIEKEIADRLHIAYNTVHVIKYNLMQKISAHNTADITRYYYDNIITKRVKRVIGFIRREGAIKARIVKTTNQPGASLQDLRTAAGDYIPTPGSIEPCENEWTHFLQLIGITDCNENTTPMNELRKIDLLQWLYANLTTDQLNQLIEIAKNIKDENERTEGKRGSCQCVQGTGKGNQSGN